jgi:pimeloyl-ACP methyl ester carboxylesterase
MVLLLATSLFLAPKGTVVMIHGAGGGGWEYDKWKPTFQRAGWVVIAKDLLPTKGKYEQTQFQDYVNQVVASAPKTGKLIYIGASMGGILALKANEKRPADAVILINSVAPKGVASMKIGEPLPSVVRWANGPLKDTEDSMPDSDRKTILWAWKLWRNESGAVMNAIRAGIEARKPKCPTLVMIGENDTDVSPEKSRLLAKWAGADVETYRGMSHVGPLLSTAAEHVANDALVWLANRLRNKSK